MSMRESLPIDPVLPEIVAALCRQPNVVVRAPTGAGKTTRVPPALLDAGLASHGKIVMLEPRRLAARVAARRMADERGGRVGDEIGYHVRFDRQCGAHTRVLTVTPGILLHYLLADPFLEPYGIVVFDEFHERGLESDLALGMVRLLQQTVRPDLRMVVMSATLAVEAVSAYLGACPVVASEGRLHPVEIRHEPRPENLLWPAAVAQAAARLLEQTAGDLLVFLPGVHEIHQTSRQLEPLARELDLAVVPLYGDLPAEKQDAALLPLLRRKIVLATNVAETSITVEGITGVVDSGLARLLVYDAGVGLDRLVLSPISKASADQRAGRAGRTRPGVCVRLWSELAHRARPEQTEPEIRRVDLAGAVLQLLRLGEANCANFPWFDPPREASSERAMTLLRRLGAVDAQGLTELGRVLARLPVQPRLGRLLMEGARHGRLERAALAAALLSEREPFAREVSDGPGRARRDSLTSSDVLDRVEALEEFARNGRSSFPCGSLKRGTAQLVLRSRDQLARSLRKDLGGPRLRFGLVGENTNPKRKRGGAGQPARAMSEEEALGRALLAAFPDRLARRREPGCDRGVMVGGRGVRLAPMSGVRDAELFLCIDVDAGKKEALVRQASAVERAWLPAEKVIAATAVLFDETTERVLARRRLCFEDLVIEEWPAAFADEEQATQALAAAAAEHLDKVLPPTDSPAGLYLLRLRCLREWLPEMQLPEFGAQELKEALVTICQGCRSFADLRRGNWLFAFQNRLTPIQRQAVEREAPERIEIPSGSRLALRYEAGRPPVLAVRIQELFGMRDTPRIAGGRQRVLLHLLAPNYRPQQVTDDLASFWTNTYPQVRKELRARYPRHAWPEDPWSAAPERRPRRRRKA